MKYIAFFILLPLLIAGLYRSDGRAAEPGPAPVPAKATPDILLPGSHSDITPDRFEVVAYMDCGVESKAQSAGVTIERVTGKSCPIEPGTHPALSADTADESLDYTVSGLDPRTDYIIGFTWWDLDLVGRRQSIHINGEEVLPDTRCIAFEEPAAKKDKNRRFRGNPTPARIQFAILPGQIADGKLDVSIRKVGPSNAVNSELWIMKRAKPAAEKQILLVSGQDYPGHHWRKTGPVMEELITMDERMEVTICETPYAVGLKHLDHYDAVFVHFKNYDSDLPSTEQMQANLEAYVKNGGGMCLSHFACGAMQEWPDFVNLSGRVWNGEGHDKRGPFTVKIVDHEHPVTAGLTDFETDDELYFCLMGDPKIHLLCEAFSQKKQADHPQAFVFRPGKGRVFLCTLGHDVKAYDAEGARQLYRQGTAWASGLGK